MGRGWVLGGIASFNLSIGVVEGKVPNVICGSKEGSTSPVASSILGSSINCLRTSRSDLGGTIHSPTPTHQGPY